MRSDLEKQIHQRKNKDEVLKVAERQTFIKDIGIREQQLQIEKERREKHKSGYFTTAPDIHAEVMAGQEWKEEVFR